MALDALACYDDEGRHTHPHVDMTRQPTGPRRQPIPSTSDHVLIDVTAMLPCGRKITEVTPGVDIGD